MTFDITDKTEIENIGGNGLISKLRQCVCETLKPPKWPFFDKCNLDI